MIGRRTEGGPASAGAPVGRWVARFGLGVGLWAFLAGVAAMIPDPDATRVATGTLVDSETSESAAPESAPTRLSFPGLELATSVVPVGVAQNGDLAIPDDPQLLGWWQDGSAPGDRTGAVVIDGHLDSYDHGIGFFVNLRRLTPGDRIVLDGRSGARTAWTVGSTTLYPRDGLPSDRLFSRDGPARLLLITCGGEFDRTSHAYTDNLVVTAYPDPAPGENDADAF